MASEYQALEAARTAAIAESTNRAGIFIGAVSAGLIALSLTATVTHIGTTFHVFALALLGTLTFIGFATFGRVLRAEIEVLHYGGRIVRLRTYYFEVAPKAALYLASTPTSRRAVVHGRGGGHWSFFRTVAGMVGVVTAVLAGSAAGTLAGIASGRSIILGLTTAGVVTVACVVLLMRAHAHAWGQASRDGFLESGQERGSG